MFIIDDALMSPFKGFLFIAKEVQKACEQQLENDRAQLMGQLTALHKMLEQGEISEDEFDERESELLEKLEKFEQ
ncbi:MAG: gas vesicle protein GvpG [Pirellula sp.]|jgi:hypothetical protein|nr:gas vesicle protein GvpG [Pirellula sp.]